MTKQIIQNGDGIKKSKPHDIGIRLKWTIHQIKI